MAVGDIISAARYNLLQASVNNVLGTGSGTFGYGQSVSSVALVPTNRVNALHMQRLKTDMSKAYIHQTGSVPVLTDVVVQDDITDAVYAEYEALAATIADANNRFDVANSQVTVSNTLTSSRSTAWGGEGQTQSITHVFTVNFGSANARRHFFNSGGEIRFSASLSGGADSKATDWAALLSSMGTIAFNYERVLASSGTASTIGNYELTSSYQTIYTRNGSGTYADNSYVIQAREDSTSVIRFSITFTDGENAFVDEPVTGTITSTISEKRATGIYVEVPQPIFATTSQL